MVEGRDDWGWRCSWGIRDSSNHGSCQKSLPSSITTITTITHHPLPSHTIQKLLVPLPPSLHLLAPLLKLTPENETVITKSTSTPSKQWTLLHTAAHPLPYWEEGELTEPNMF